MITRLFLAFLFIFLAESASYAVVVGDHFEALSPEERQLLEQEISNNPPVSLCSKTYEFSRSFRPILQHQLPLTDFLLMDKKRRMLHLMSQNEVLGSYMVALGGSPRGHKVKEGDEKTPEGLYFIDLKNYKSDYHLSLRINYPNFQDQENARRNNIKKPGENIMLHGLPNNWFKRRLIKHPRDWTKGCMAVTNHEIEEIFENIKLGTRIEICP